MNMFAFFLWKQFKILIDKNISFKKIVYPLFVTQDSGYKHHLMKKWTKHAYQKSYIRTSNESVCIHIRPTIPMTHDCLNLPNNHVTAAHLPPSLVFLTTQGQSLVNHVFFLLGMGRPTGSRTPPERSRNRCTVHTTLRSWPRSGDTH
jgi:hypothetical protein